MNGEGRECAIRDCRDNDGGRCANTMLLPLAFAPGSVFPPGPVNFAAPFGLAAGALASVSPDCPLRQKEERQ